MRVLVVEPIAAEGIARLRAVHDVDERPGITRQELCAILKDYDALLVRSQVQVDAEVIAAAGNRLQVVGLAGVAFAPTQNEPSKRHVADRWCSPVA